MCETRGHTEQDSRAGLGENRAASAPTNGGRCGAKVRREKTKTLREVRLKTSEGQGFAGDTFLCDWAVKVWSRRRRREYEFNLELSSGRVRVTREGDVLLDVPREGQAGELAGAVGEAYAASALAW